MNRSIVLTLVSVILFTSIMAYGTMVLAQSNGISGYSITGCSCHTAVSPEVNVSVFGPTIVIPDGTYTFTVTVTGGPLAFAGLDVSVTSGTLAVIDATNTMLESGEITHTEAGTSLTSWSFNWTATSTYGNVTMYAAGLSADGNGRKNAEDLGNITSLSILVTIPGDVNGDRIVDIFDIGYISAHWYPGPPIGPSGYDANADINNDEAVDIFDIGITSANWGQTW